MAAWMLWSWRVFAELGIESSRFSAKYSGYLDAAGNIVSVFAYGEKSHVPSLMHKAGRTWRLITDHLGSVREVVDVESGQVAQALRYDAWGNVLHDSNPGFQPFGYAGGLYDRDTGLTRFGARDYDPLTGRWTAKDPIGFGGGDSNVYAYVGGDPVNFIDPTGLERFPGYCMAYDALLRNKNDAGAAHDELLGERIARNWDATDDYGNRLRNAENYLTAYDFVARHESERRRYIAAYAMGLILVPGHQVVRGVQNVFGYERHSMISLEAVHAGWFGTDDGLKGSPEFDPDCECSE